ncbi:MAG: AtpZ/AtpI family protein [Lentimicrobiaceae bacterium]|jgi:membrane protein DedA with SNARE-associated domain|nr:AtpZ/AtpI family protein [Lentimicrobiaceae bacterium]
MKQKNKPTDSLHNYVKYSSLGIQMLVIILLGVFGGRWIDHALALQKPVFTAILALISVFFAIYYAIKDFLKQKKE